MLIFVFLKSMKSFTKIGLSLLFSLVTQFCFAQMWTKDNLRTYETFDEMEHIFEYGGDTTYVINFWATWCGPCVKELPYFTEIPTEDEHGNPIRVILVSLDFPKQLETKLIPYLNDQKIKSEVIYLKDGKYNEWIDKVDPEWSGAIPITVIYNQHGRNFLEREFHSTEEILEQIPIAQ